ncbi:bifunctional diguanylate cyclase/phosphodiesterase [Sulfurospirillum sp. T05]|uniref:Bifunctional diguanylate cyclase/phosphodiesterase n=1 Tax=Sulfurospirillum tamanense TaxID=2813362 RepID=A0ABS2WSD7_9BACT|nr:bifunctional diguanylate cyclase/phosphodiesterase [Sulfurospirillum tamanensis]
MSRKFSFKNPFYLIGLSLVVGVVLGALLYGTVKLEEKVEAKMFEISTSDIFHIAQNSAKTITSLLNTQESYVTQIQRNTLLQQEIEAHLRILPTKNIKYAYLLYRDARGVFRFLADASAPFEKALLNQKLDVTSPAWNEIYEKKEPLIIRHDFLKALSISYLTPLLNNQEVQLVLAIDFSVEKVESINTILAFMKTTLLTTIGIMVLFFIVLIVQTYRYVVAKKSAYIDKLTNTYNRNYLQELEEFINLGDYALAALDIDHFKKVNDTYGHHAGDMILKDVASIILANTRKKDDIVIRYGGEEFVILSKIKRTDHASPLNIFERIFTSIQAKAFHVSNSDTLHITVSMGINLALNQSRTFSDAFKLADIALYNAKHRGRNCIEIYEENKNSHKHTHLTIGEINVAIEEDRVVCFFQQIVHTQSKKLSHYEALLRIVDKDGSIITPSKILPAIKGTFVLRNITKRVLEICYATLCRHPAICINVNLNPQDIINETILDLLKEYAKEKNIAQRIGLEIVESEEFMHYKHADENLLMLKSLGYTISIDDFGTGYSNFVYLTQIQTDFIKIDGDIIKNIVEDKVSLAVVKSIVNFAKEAKIQVVAEYVCNEEIYNIVNSLGIEYCQGHYFSIPKASPA